MSLVQFSNSNLICIIYQNKRIDCSQSKTQTSLFSLDIGSSLTESQTILQHGEWYLLTLRSNQGKSYLSLFDVGFKDRSGPIAEAVSNSFSPFRQMVSAFDVYLGINQNSNGNQLQGSIRQLAVFTRYMSSLNEIMVAATSVPTDAKMYMTLFNMTSGLVEKVSSIQAQQIGRASSSTGIIPQLDFKPHFLCLDANGWDGIACKD